MAQKMWASSFSLKTSQSKHSPNGRKFAQSGHPAHYPEAKK
jgi:hypothetical protein